MPDSETGTYLLKKLYDKVMGNGVPGVVQNLEKQSKMFEKFAKDNTDDHALILRELRQVRTGHDSLKKKVDKHVKSSKLGNRLKHAGEEVESFMEWLVKLGKKAVQIILILSAISAGLYGLFHRQIDTTVKVLNATAIQEHINIDKP